MIEITDECMPLTVDAKVVATARFCWPAAADGYCAWIVSTHPARLTRDGAIAALAAAELGESGCPDSHQLMVALREDSSGLGRAG